MTIDTLIGKDANAQDVIAHDLDYICSNLRAEFGSMSGKSLLITGGAGFLGYYLVQSVLGWNKKSDKAGRIQVTVYDNYLRGFRLAFRLEDPGLLKKYDVSSTKDMGDFSILSCRFNRVATYYRKYPLRPWTNVTGLRNLLEYSTVRKNEKPG
jgi:nucleoside-diphosphate-sugar epimerase